ncbi:T9SS type A sorting domain-containing protein [bacterium]|nr:T9SS type A sorting domain-containing protein [bacterium]
MKVILAVLLSVTALTVSAQVSVYVEYLTTMELGWGAIADVFYQDNTAWVTTHDTGVKRLDFSDWEAPRLEASSNPQNMYDVIGLTEGFLYTTSWDSLHIFVVSEMDTITQVYSTEGICRRRTITSFHPPALYILDSPTLLAIYSIENPTLPEFVSNVTLPDSAFRIFNWEDKLIVAGIEGVMIYNIDDPFTPIEVDFDSPGELDVIGIDSNHLILGTYEELEFYQLIVGEPPNYLTTFELPEVRVYYDFFFLNGKGFFPANSNDVFVYDIVDPFQIEFLYNQPYTEIYAENDNLLMTKSHYGTIQVMDLNDPENITEVASIPDPIYITDMILGGDYLYTSADYPVDLCAINIAQPESPRLEKRVPYGKVDLVDDDILISSSGYYLYTIDVSQLPDSLVLLDSITVRTSRGKAKDGNLLWCLYSSGDAYIQLLDVEDPGDIIDHGIAIQEESNLLSLTLAEDVLFTFKHDTLLSYDISNPFQPMELEPILPGDWLDSGVLSFDIVLENEILFIFSREYTLDVTTVLLFDVINPALPTYMTSFVIDGFVDYPVVKDHALYYFDTESTFTIMDIRNLNHPEILHEIPVPEYTTDIIVADENIYLSARFFLYVFSLDNDLDAGRSGKTNVPLEFQLSSIYPNPFNSSVMIKFSLPSPGDITLSVFDLMGREVATIIEGSRSSGHHQTVWNGMDQTGMVVPSGTYFIKLDSKLRQQTQQIHYVR